MADIRNGGGVEKWRFFVRARSWRRRVENQNMKKWKWYVYIAECEDGTYYTGLTWNIINREFQHGAGKGSKYTSKHGFKKIAYFEEHSNFEMALKREKQIKDWSRSKKEKLIKGEMKFHF